MNMEHKKKDIETHSGEWLLKYDDLESRLERAKEILNKYPKNMPPFNRAPLPFETVEILLSDIQELTALMETNHSPRR
ncbi:unnamed protein product [marine sediment metagenome]|uniref:Uncharacterized protein n=1 Tax=marine sediment metagenome TaxID=412755 RepID=X1PGK0_9ZZZZ